MADYNIPQYVDKRTRYFNNQFLQEQDFIDEQKYHINHLRQHQRSLHTPGIAEGLTVEAPIGATEATVKPGVAIDKEGRQIVLTGDRTIPLTDATFHNQKVVLAIAYGEEASDPVGGGETRLFERPIMRLFLINDPNISDTTMRLRLAILSIGDDGRVSTAPDLSVRLGAGINLGEPTLTKITFSRTNVQDATQFPTLSSGAANRVDIQGSLTVSSTVNGRDLARDGNKLDSLSAEQIGALPTKGGTVTGNLAVDGADLTVQQRGRVGGNLNVGSPSVSNIRLSVQSSTPNPGTTPAPGALGALFVWNGSPTSYGIVSKVSSTPTNVNPPLGSGAAIAGIANMDNVFGVYAQAKDGTPALFVQGVAKFSGDKGGYVVDTFVNASGQRLNVGDVVKLKGTPIVRFEGDNGRIPVPDVTLADQENDSKVIGIVSREAVPNPGMPDNRVQPEDSTFAETGGEVFVVTLGTFAICKVDATQVPIEVGDLLTTSNNPGHAKKATEPKLGCIIGKALQSFGGGTGHIAVFVNIQ